MKHLITSDSTRLDFTFKDFLIKCVDALGNDDSQCSSTQQPGSQYSHQLQLLLQKPAPYQHMHIQKDQRSRLIDNIIWIQQNNGEL